VLLLPQLPLLALLSVTCAVAQAWHFGKGVFCPASASNNVLLLKNLNLQSV
jgi:hypothetical protein